jgi:hypothetical protein
MTATADEEVLHEKKIYIKLFLLGNDNLFKLIEK